MRRWLIFALFLVVSLDFATLDAPLLPAGPGPVPWDDEEESVPSRPLRLRRVAPPVTAALPEHRYVAPTETRRLPDHTVRADRRTHPPEWLVPIGQVRLSSRSSASPPEDH